MEPQHQSHARTSVPLLQGIVDTVVDPKQGVLAET